MCTDCKEITIPIGPTGANGTNGTNGTNGVKGDTGLPGPNGQNGTSILATYNSATGLGTPSSLIETTLFTTNLAANTLGTDGDELEAYVYYQYTSPDSATLRVKLGSKILTLGASGSISDIRVLVIKISRISNLSQFWTIKQDNTVVNVPFVTTDSSTVDLSTILAFEISGQNNTTSVANQLLVKKVTLYKYKI